MSMDKWYYIRLISEASNRYGDKLVEMMEKNGKNNLQEITYEEVKEFYEKLNNK